jgi:hypothetical protein
MRKLTLVVAGLFVSTVAGSLAAQTATRLAGVDVWLDTDFFESASKAQAFFDAIPGTYVVVVRVTTVKTLEVLYPAAPTIQTPYVRNEENRTKLNFRTDPVVGLGLLYAISADKPFDFSNVADGNHWISARLTKPTGLTPAEIAGYFFNDILTAPGAHFAMAQAAYINGTATYRVGDPGFPTVASVIDAAGLACYWSGRDTQGRVCGDTLAAPVRLAPPPTKKDTAKPVRY